MPEICVLFIAPLFALAFTKLSTDQEPLPLIEVAWLSWRSTLPVKELAIRFPTFEKTHPAGPATGPCAGIAPRSPTPPIPDRPVVGDCGRKLNESVMLKIQLRVT